MKKKRIVDDKLMGRLELSGLRIAFYRKRRGLTQDQLAELTNISRSFLARVGIMKMIDSIFINER